MNTLTQYNTLVPSLFEGDIFDLFFKNFPLTSGFNASRDPYDVWLRGDGTSVLEYALVGFDEKDINVSVVGNQLKIEASSSKEEKEDGEFIHRKIARRNVKKLFSLHDSIDKEKISAVYKNGLLRIELPERKEEQKEIKVKVIT